MELMEEKNNHKVKKIKNFFMAGFLEGYIQARLGRSSKSKFSQRKS